MENRYPKKNSNNIGTHGVLSTRDKNGETNKIVCI